MTIACPECGCVLDDPQFQKKSKPRSYPQLQRYHVLCRAAYDNWPRSHWFQPKSPDHLRYWLEVQAGHFKPSKTTNLRGLDPDLLLPVLESVMRSSDDEKQFVEIDGQLLVVKRALSISYKALSHLGACGLFKDVEDVIEAEMNCKVEDLMKEAA